MNIFIKPIFPVLYAFMELMFSVHVEKDEKWKIVPFEK